MNINTYSHKIQSSETMDKRSDVTALYVEPNGPYPDLVEDWYDAARDARTYQGNNPIVAHPPCGPWGQLHHLCTRQDKTLGLVSVAQVQQWGGVLEHPAQSKLFKECNLPLPGRPSLFAPGFTIKVEQWIWGHRTVKPTWLYIVGLKSNLPPMPVPDIKKRPSGYGAAGRRGGLSDSPMGLLSKLERRLSPTCFAKWLVEVAANCNLSELG